MRAVTWSTRAKRSLAEILDHFEHRDEPEVARRLIERIAAAGEALGRYPTGRPGRVPNTYLKSLPDLRYILVYSIQRRQDGENVAILDVVHAMRDWVPGNLPPRP